ncbi:tyrosine-type recombinase/integrase [Plantibacter sp. CFBP 13570]|nr:tyrosine-type recombinase/integrase [Plantibacter sp. CFBP 13570]
MRHTCASLLLSQGVQMPVVMESLGHSNMAITSDIYSHVAPATLKSASAEMNSVLDARGPSLNRPLSCAGVRRRALALPSAVAASVAVNRAENHT